jgi:hypothetical protein
MDNAISSGVSAPISRPTGPDTRLLIRELSLEDETLQIQLSTDVTYGLFFILLAALWVADKPISIQLTADLVA